ncbi:nucleotidyltransferase domain-containing protein [Limnofasciculus baicalensis]|uniref:Nucleotidyltransferase family protein n=1 Tax=Limnofasciculus baicalensis BBK-W-15 TaxID=2699891 RepID=A0AAE3GV46_9CYAN|nr:nucleotidyltransferase family protein [Limnofasciculus baicalensis]MCP2731231.1 nucleotidyltransferase family protein [Limnofasciculus baicalensis BBK-W-15]
MTLLKPLINNNSVDWVEETKPNNYSELGFTSAQPNLQSNREVQILLSCTRTTIDSQTAASLKILLQETIDWQYLLKIAKHHKVMPLLYWNLNNTCPEAVPPDKMALLQNHFNENARRSLFLSVELVKIINLLESHNIPVIPFKGPVLAVSAYNNLALRQFSDLDILVQKQHINQAKALFLSHGYRMKIECIKPNESQTAKFIKSPDIYKLVRECAYPFIKKKTGVLAELHWGVMPEFFSFPIEEQGLWSDLEQIAIAGKTVSNFSPENTLLILCGHGAKDCWAELPRICDIAELIRSHPQLNWKIVLERATIMGSERMLLLGLLLAQNILEISLPNLVEERIEADSMVRKLAEDIKVGLFAENGSTTSIGQLSKFHIIVRERLWEKIQYCLQTVFTPTTSDWLLLPLVRFPAWFYYPLRFLRLAINVILRKVKTRSLKQEAASSSI